MKMYRCLPVLRREQPKDVPMYRLTAEPSVQYKMELKRNCKSEALN